MSNLLFFNRSSNSNESILQDVVDEAGYYYVNSTDVIQYIPRYYIAPSMLYSPDRLHYGIIGRSGRFEYILPLKVSFVLT